MPLAHWQGAIRGYTFGAGQVANFGEGGISGLGTPVPRSADQERGDRDGDVGGDDVLPRRILSIPLVLDGGWANLQPLKRAWRPLRAPGEVALDLCVPGFPSSNETLRFYGRPRGLDADLVELKGGEIAVFATFDALDPFGYGPEETVALASGANVVNHQGDGISDRWTLELTRTGAASSLENDLDSEPGLSLAAGAETLILDGRVRTVKTAGGDDRYALVQPGSGWPVLEEGANTLTLTGGTGSLAFRPAFE